MSFDLPKVNTQSALVSPKFILTTFALQGLKINTYKPTGSEVQDAASATSYLGTPVFSNLVIHGGSYITDSGQSITYPELRIDTVLMDVMQSKNIIITELQGRDTAVKEYISKRDYEINIKGVIQGQGNGIYPEDDIKKLIQIFDVNDTIAITSTYLNRLGIYNIVIKGFTLNQPEAYYNLQPFNITAISDLPLQLLSNNA